MQPDPQPDPRSRREPSARDILAPLARARQLQLDGHYAAAEARYRAVLKLEPYQPQALFHLALLVWSLGRPVEALRYLRQAIAVEPSLSGASERLAELLHTLGRQ